MARPKPDFTQVAHRIFLKAIGEDNAPASAKRVEESRKALAGRAGGKKGGVARAAKMTPAERSEAARKAAAKRWGRRQT